MDERVLFLVEKGKETTKVGNEVVRSNQGSADRIEPAKPEIIIFDVATRRLCEGDSADRIAPASKPDIIIIFDVGGTSHLCISCCNRKCN